MNTTTWTTIEVRPLGSDFTRGLGWLRRAKAGEIVEGNARLAASYDAATKTWRLTVPERWLQDLASTFGDHQEALRTYRVEEV